MISPSVTTKRYALQTSLINMHRESLYWLSAAALWRRELHFMQKLLDDHASSYTTKEDKQDIERFQNLIIYYGAEVIIELESKLRAHENQMADTLRRADETDVTYFKTHESIIEELVSFDEQFNALKQDLFGFIEKVL